MELILLILVTFYTQQTPKTHYFVYLIYIFVLFDELVKQSFSHQEREKEASGIGDSPVQMVFSYGLGITHSPLSFPSSSSLSLCSGFVAFGLGCSWAIGIVRSFHRHHNSQTCVPTPTFRTIILFLSFV